MLFLLADDSPAKLLMLKGIVQRAEFSVQIVEAATTEEAIQLIQKHPEIAYAFIDYQMPKKNGPAVIRALKQANPAARVALVTASTREDFAQEALAAGAERVICTSYESDEVERELLELVDQWKI